jgi:SAM-dependent methyltransferase
MHLSTAVEMLRTGQLRLLSAAMRLASPVYRFLWLSAAVRERVLVLLREGPKTLDELARALQIPSAGREGLAAWLEFGVGLGELEQGGAGYYLKGFFAKRLAAPEGDPVAALMDETAVLHARLLLESLPRMRKGTPFTLADQDGEVVARSSRTLEPVVNGAVDAFVPARGAPRLLEIGCGSGTYIRRACARNPELSALGVELQPLVAEQARSNLEAWGLAGRAKVEAGDVRARSPRPEFDLATMHNNIYYFPVPSRVDLFRHVRGFLKPGGALLLTTSCRGGGPLVEALNLWGAVTENCGRLPDPDELVGQLREAGFADARAERLILGESFFGFTARAP